MYNLQKLSKFRPRVQWTHDLIKSKGFRSQLFLGVLLIISQTNGTCLLQLENTTDKIEIMKNKLKLRNLKDKKIYIIEDWSREERKIQNTITTAAKEEEMSRKRVTEN
jgi:hypothetical protein